MAGMDKSPGMIHLSMGPYVTLLGVLPCSLQSVLTYAVDHSFDSVSIDQDMSMNNMVITFANGTGAAQQAAWRSMRWLMWCCMPHLRQAHTLHMGAHAACHVRW